MKPCPNCQQPVQYYAQFCPNCGYVLVPPVQDKLITNIPWVDVLLGLLASLISPLVAGFGFIVAIVLYFVLRQSYSYFAKGLLVGFLIVLALLLGAVAICIGIIATSK